MSTPEISSQQINAKDLFMVLIVTVSWGLNYPVMKFVVNSYPPSAFRTFTFLIGCMALGAYVRFKGISIAVPKHEIRPLFKLSLFNMVGWHLPMIYGVSMLNSGRAAIIGYTMPVWALLASALLYREKITMTALIGIALAMSAALLLAQCESVGKPSSRYCGYVGGSHHLGHWKRDDEKLQVKCQRHHPHFLGALHSLLFLLGDYHYF